MSRKSNQKIKKVFLIAGRTGGPIVPLMAIAKNLKNAKIEIIGVKNSFEERLSKEENLTIHYLPYTKLDILSFTRFDSIWEFIGYIPKTILNIFDIFWGFLKALILNLIHKPDMIISTGSFLAVPTILTTQLLKKIGILKTKIVIHQQDPMAGKANKLTAKFSDLLTYTFDYSKEKYPEFDAAKKIPNPIDISRFGEKNLEKVENQAKKSYPELIQFLNQKNSPTLFIFGGGTGAQKINKWVFENINELTKNFKVLHFTGAILKEEAKIKNPDYLSYDALFDEMPLILKKSDFVLCRSGLGTITELEFLKKKAFLAPIPHHHQELNADLVKDYFYVLDQRDGNEKNWLKEIQENYKTYFQKITFPKTEETEEKLKKYYQKIQDLLDKN